MSFMHRKHSSASGCAGICERPPPRKNGFKAPGFTLVELLVVIAVTGVLAALLLPALRSAKARAAQVQCISNERQMLLAWMIYSSDNGDRLVLNGGDMASSSASPHLWVYGGDHSCAPATFTNAQYLTGAACSLFAFAGVQPGLQLYKCPADVSTWPLATQPPGYFTELRSYALNSYMGIRGAALVPPLTVNNAYKIYTKFSDVAADAPASRFVFADVNPASICTPGFGVDVTAQSWIHYPSGLHSGKGVIVFADGHTEAHRWVDPRTTMQPGTGNYLPHATASPNNPDLTWLAAQTSSKK